MEGNTRLKRKRVSKNKKKSWRKHTDITDVEEALDDERLQQRTGGLVAEKTDESLFFVDKSTEEDVKEKAGLAHLRCYSNLEPDPQTVAALIPRTSRKRKAKKKDSVSAKKSTKVLDAEDQGLEAVRQRELRQTLAKLLPVATHDLWTDDVNPQNDTSLESFHLEYTRKKPVKPPKTYRKKTSGLSAVDVPHPGASYNPAFDDHQDLLSKANLVEIEKEKKERFIQKALDEKFPTKSEAPSEETWIKEMSVGLADNQSDNEESEGSGDDNDRLSVNPVVRREDKKTLRQRRQEKERKDQVKTQRLGKVKKQKASEFFRLKSIRANIKSREKQLADRKKKKETLQEIYKNKPKKLGKLRFEEQEMEIKLSDELKGSLRELKPEGHLLEDRFKAFQRRNMIETRKRAKFVRKYKPKKFEKKGHKAVQI